MDHGSMDHRVVPASRGLAWLRQAVGMLEHSPRGLAQVASAYVLIRFLPAMVPAQNLQFVLTIGLLLAGPALAAGLLFAIGEVQAGRPVALGHLFEGLRRPGVRVQLLVLGFFVLTETLLMALSVQRIIGPEHMKTLMLLMQQKLAPDSAAAHAAAVPIDSPAAQAAMASMFKAMLAAFAIGLVLWTGLFFSVPRVMFDGRPGLLAIFESFGVCASNILPMFVYVLAMAVAGFVLLIALAIVSAVMGALGKIGALLFVPVFVAAMVAGFIVAYSGNFLAWRDVFGRPGDGGPPQAGIMV
jgi:hypothetical protein